MAGIKSGSAIKKRASDLSRWQGFLPCLHQTFKIVVPGCQDVCSRNRKVRAVTKAVQDLDNLRFAETFDEKVGETQALPIGDGDFVWA